MICPRRVRQIRLDRMSFTGIPPLRRSVPRTEDHLAALLYTSGTSGRPKGVMLTASNLTANVRQCVEWAGLPRRTVFLGVLPQFHCFGLTVLTLLPLWLGAKAVYTAPFVPQKVLELTLETSPAHRPGHSFDAERPAQAKGATREHFSSVRLSGVGRRAAAPARVRRFQERFGVTLNEGYGLTETSPVANWCRPQDHKRFSVGPPLPGVEEKIVSLDGTELGVDQEGEVRIKGPNLMKGYYKLDEETAAAIDEEGYFRTGDIGRIDADGHLYITGRLKEMMVIGGENVFPRTIEEVLDRHPAVVCSAVIGIADPGRGEVPVAFVELVTEADVRARRSCGPTAASTLPPTRSLAGYPAGRNAAQPDRQDPAARAARAPRRAGPAP